MILGRTAPTLRASIDYEVLRLQRLVRHIRDKELREALKDALSHADELHDAYLTCGPPNDPMEVILLSMIAEIYRRLGSRGCVEP